MAEIRFSCSACHQHITCDEAWGGHQIQCPSCGKTINVPAKVSAAPTAHGAPPAQTGGNSLVPKVPEANRLALSQNAQQPAPAAPRNIPIRDLTTPKPKKEGPWKSIGVGAAILVILGLSAYFGWPYVSKMFNKEEVAAAPASTPAKQEVPTAAETAPADPMAPPAPPAEAPGAAPGTATAAPVQVIQKGAVIPAVYKLDLASAKIPSGRVNGKLSGSAFLPETVRLDPLGTAQVLRFSEGELMSPDRELLVYLHLKPGDKLKGQKIEISQDMRTRYLPQITKRWKTNPKYAPTMRSFSSGYILKLEIDQHANGIVKGKIYVALPDNEQSVAAGNFSAATTIPVEGIAAPTAVPGAAPVQPAPGVAAEQMPPELRRRYGR